MMRFGQLIVVLTLVPGNINAQDGGRLELVLAAEHPLPEGFAPAAVHSTQQGSFAVRGVNDSRLLIFSGGASRVLTSADLTRPIGLHMLPGDTIIEVLDGDSRELMLFRMDGSVAARRSIRIPLQIDQGFRLSERWLMVGTDDGGSLSLAWSSTDGASAIVTSLPVPDSSRPDVHLSATATSLLVGLLGPPYTVWEVHPDSQPQHAGFADPRMLTGQDEDSSEPVWVSVALIPVGDRYIRTFADIRGDRRHFILYDADRTIIRETRVDSPMALISHVPDHHVLVGIRNITGPELLLYAWRWETGM